MQQEVCQCLHGNMNDPRGHLYGEFGECDALSCACAMDLYEQRWEHDIDIFPFFRLILRCPAIFLRVFFPRKLKDLARWFACHANIWLFAASVASTWAFRFGMGDPISEKRGMSNDRCEYGGQ